MKVALILSALVGFAYSFVEFNLSKIDNTEKKLNWHKLQALYSNPTVSKLMGGTDIPLVNLNDAQYYMFAQVGTPGRSFRILVDTGSADIWLPSTNCTQVCCRTKNLYDPKESSTYKPDGRVVNVTYVLLDCNGVMASDKFQMGSLVIDDLSFVEAWNFTVTYNGAYFDGMIGLGGDKLNQMPTTTFMDALMEKKLIQEKSFGLYFTQTGSAPGSILTVGGINDAMYVPGTLTYHKANIDYYWVIKMLNAYANNATTFKLPINGILDSGFGVIQGGQLVVLGFLNAIGYGPGAIVPCSEVRNFPVIGFTIMDSNDKVKKYPLTGEQYVWSFMNQGQLTCALQIGVIEFPPSFGAACLLGETFTKVYYTHYDFTNSQVGLATAVKN